jgi:hypothetical protein
MDDYYSETELQNAREALLVHYNSKVTVHGAYILTSIIAVLTFFQIFPLSEFLKSDVYLLFLSLSLSAMLTLLSHIIGRTIYWGYMAHEVIFAYPISQGQVKKTWYKGRDVNLLGRLHLASDITVKAKHKSAGHFSGLHLRLLLLLFFTYFVFLYVFLWHWYHIFL